MHSMNAARWAASAEHRADGAGRPQLLPGHRRVRGRGLLPRPRRGAGPLARHTALGGSAWPGGSSADDAARRPRRARDPVTDDRLARHPAPEGAGVRPDLPGTEVGVAAVGARRPGHRARRCRRHTTPRWTRRSATSNGAAGFTRRGQGRRSSRSGADGFVAAAFRHRTSRADDPLLHTHVLVANLAHTADDERVAVARCPAPVRCTPRPPGYLYQAQLRARAHPPRSGSPSAAGHQRLRRHRRGPTGADRGVLPPPRRASSPLLDDARARLGAGGPGRHAGDPTAPRTDADVRSRAARRAGGHAPPHSAFGNRMSPPDHRPAARTDRHVGATEFAALQAGWLSDLLG